METVESDLCMLEIDVLRSIAGEDVPNLLRWGAAVGQAFEFLRGSGYLQLCDGKWEVSDRGKKFLQARRKA